MTKVPEHFAQTIYYIRVHIALRGPMADLPSRQLTNAYIVFELGVGSCAIITRALACYLTKILDK